MSAEKYYEKIARKVGQNIRKYKLIEPNDKVLVGLSGGKDSMVLLETLANRKKHLPFPFNLYAVHIHMPVIGYQVNQEYLKDFCEQLDVPFYSKNTEFEIENKDSEKQICFLCSWHRRKSIFELTKELNCNKLAFGHHMDDVVETLLINMVYHGSISSMPFKLKMFDGRVHLIRPLLNLFEQEMITYANFRNFPMQVKDCPYEKETKRDTMKKILKEVDQLHSKAKINIFRSTGKIITEYLPE